MLRLLPLFVILSFQGAWADSYFFTTDGARVGADTIKDGSLITSLPIKKLPTPKALNLSAYYVGMGRGRDYQIQMDLKGALDSRSIPRIKLEDEILYRGVSMSFGYDEDQPFSLFISSDNKEDIKRWSRLLSKFLKIPRKRVMIDLAPPKEEPHQEKDQTETTPEWAWNLDGETEWSFGNGRDLKLRRSDEGRMIFQNPKGEPRFQLEPGERLSDLVKSPGGKVLFFQISNRDGIGGCFLRVTGEGKKIRFERLWPYPKTPLFGKNRWWISELGAIDDAGETLLAKMGWMPQGIGRVSYEWQTWSISRKERLGRGLRIPSKLGESQ